MFPYKPQLKNLYAYSIFMGINGTATLSTVIFWLIPEDQLSKEWAPLSIESFGLYGSCIAALVVRDLFFKKEKISSKRWIENIKGISLFNKEIG